MKDAARWSVWHLLPHALAFAVGALLAGYAALAAWSVTYMRASPAVGSVSGGGGWFAVLLFLVGATTAFLAAASALARIRAETG